MIKVATQHFQGDREGQVIADHNTVSLVMGILGIMIPFVGVICAIIAIVLGTKTRKAYNRAVADGKMPCDPSGFPISKKTGATIGTILGYISCSGYLLAILLLGGCVAAFSQESALPLVNLPLG